MKERGFIPILILVLIPVFLALGALAFARQGVFKQKARTDSIASPSASISQIPVSKSFLKPQAKPSATTTPSQSGNPPNSTPGTNQPSPNRINSKIFLLIFNPIIESQGNKKLTQVKSWNNPDSLTNSFINSIRSSSEDTVKYSIAQKEEIDAIPVKADGFAYTDESYLNCLNNSTTCHQPDLANYQKFIADYGICEKLNSGEINELWVWGGPYFGYWEANLAGPNAFWYNSPPTANTSCNKLLPIMGFSYERGEAEMFEDLSHRVEATMTKVYGGWSADEATAWNQFTLLDVDKPGRGGCGNAHNAVNAQSNNGYDRENTRSVPSICDDFFNYPNLTGTTKNISCSAWGCTTLGYHKWWFAHLPRAQGQNDGKLNNWWEYLITPQRAL